ncbi:HNH endonuclease domain-containing protein [Pectinatus frisingensis]|uniref:HNH endonuclease domain-containing protein n=1 Tax=Pectinatus frisingensis TaxID=865 RepID=UPI0018C6091E|nr:HNH endonuclease domain-containing protein [Pectinatus frisingensis]
MLQIFVRDGFIDRYTGNKLIFPGTLRILSELMPQEFPYHLNWKMDACHIAWWQLSPTIDHILPIARGGNNEPDNLVCTSMLKNKTKDNFLLDELGWNLFPAGDFEKWDGLINWFIKYVENNRSILNCNYIANWYKPVKHVLNNMRRLSDIYIAH